MDPGNTMARAMKSQILVTMGDTIVSLASSVFHFIDNEIHKEKNTLVTIK
jgi:hypothetical protein